MRMNYESHKHYHQVKKALETIQDRLAQSAIPITLESLAGEIAMSKHHFQLVFSEWVGISPKRFQQYLVKNQAQQLLNEHTVEDTALELGLSGSSRLYDLMATTQGVTPGEYKRQGNELNIHYGWADSPFGQCFIAQTKKGVCKLAFFDEPFEKRQLINELNTDWKPANIQENQQQALETVTQIFPNTPTKQAQRLHLIVKGTPFQLQVWEALLRVPEAKLCSYSMLAESINKSGAVRAVSSAIAKNSIAYLIPCHRVIRKCGAINQYRWGATRKQAMLIKERFS